MCPTALGRKEKKLYNVHIVHCSRQFPTEGCYCQSPTSNLPESHVPDNQVYPYHPSWCCLPISLKQYHRSISTTNSKSELTSDSQWSEEKSQDSKMKKGNNGVTQGFQMAATNGIGVGQGRYYKVGRIGRSMQQSHPSWSFCCSPVSARSHSFTPRQGYI